MAKHEELSKHPTKGYRISLSYYTTSEGKRSPRVWWLGQQLRTALELEEIVRECFKREVTDKGLTEWTPEAIEFTKRKVEALRQFQCNKLANAIRNVSDAGFDVIPVSAPKAVAKAVMPVAATPVPMAAATLYGAIDAYLEALNKKRLSNSHKRRAEEVLKHNLKNVRTDCPLAKIDYMWLDSLCDHFKARPKLKSGNLMKPGTVKVVLQYCRQLFVWIDDNSYGGWEAPRKLMKPFEVKICDLMTSAECRMAGTIEQFDMATLKALYAKASDFQKMLMLMALFTGATQQELAVMEQSEFDLEASMLHHFRNKTHVEGKFWLPPELVSLLKTSFKHRKSDTLAFRTCEGNPLVTYRDGRKVSDAVRQSWDDLRENAGIPKALTFKYLRKFLADWMTRNGGETIGQIALSHANHTILSKHYTTVRDFPKFNALQKQMHTELLAAGVLGDVPLRLAVAA